MLKFKFTATRIEEAVTIPEYIGSLNGNLGYVLRLLPKMLIDEKGNYIVKVNQDENGLILGYEGLEEAEEYMMNVSAGRLKSLTKELVEALGGVINPTKDSDSKEPLSTEPQQPPTG